MEKLYGKDLALKANRARLLAVEAVHRAASGHPGGSLSCLDALTALYFNEMRVDPANPQWAERDRFVLSKGHCAPALYAVLALRGFFPVEDLQMLRSIKSHLSGHPDMKYVPGVDMSTGSLGQGLSTAVGMALAAKHTGKTFRTYAICGDGEIEEGQIWEAVMAAAKWKLDNLCAFIDVNGLQIDGNTADVMPSEPLDQKLEAFNWHVVKIDGHNIDQILSALAEARSCKGMPTAILMKTVKGKGVSYMENNAGWHGKAPNADEFAIARAELEAKIKELEEN
ncbi:MAG: transketolase [Oscillospiraceae bacterium]|jgi:transketolase|nr:transketolase [Oscillospiraceae bacterium]MBQ2144578.1 transketolase [Oscillospiraceae bacterium]MBQ4302816.1 transketolase [Oscillospiraceae bacterium]MBQ5467750.1 transketolase [Oscillospiraceae bacterium]MBQ6031145.1 transketolase [Oscillospiraceae bacterium]